MLLQKEENMIHIWQNQRNIEEISDNYDEYT